MKRSKSKVLFSFHDVQCQIELNNLFFSVNLCFSLASLSLMLHKETHKTYAHYYPTRNNMKNVQIQAKKEEHGKKLHTITVYLCI